MVEDRVGLCIIPQKVVGVRAELKHAFLESMPT